MSTNIQADDVEPSLAFHMESLEAPSGIHSVRSIYTGASPGYGPSDDANDGSMPSGVTPVKFQSYETIQNTIQDAVRTIGNSGT